MSCIFYFATKKKTQKKKKREKPKENKVLHSLVDWTLALEYKYLTDSNLCEFINSFSSANQSHPVKGFHC